MSVTSALCRSDHIHVMLTQEASRGIAMLNQRDGSTALTMTWLFVAWRCHSVTSILPKVKAILLVMTGRNKKAAAYLV